MADTVKYQLSIMSQLEDIAGLPWVGGFPWEFPRVWVWDGYSISIPLGLWKFHGNI